MLKRMVLPAALMVSTLGFALTPVASARDRDDWGRNYRHEARERQEWREHERFERRYRAHGYYDRFGYWHGYRY